MDSVYSVYNTISSAKVDIGKYFDMYHRVVSDESTKLSHGDGDNSVASFMPSSLEEEELNMLAEYCSIEKLSVPGEVNKYDQDMITSRGSWSFKHTDIPKGTGLATLSKLEEMYATQKLTSITSLRKYTGEIPIQFEKSPSDGPMAVPGKDIVVYVRVYKPFNATQTTKRKLVMSSVIAALGTQTLDKVRDLIDCVSDLSVAKEVSENPDTPVGPAAKDIYKSGFFYIEGTFYNDFRDGDSKDNSRVIKEWAETRGLGPFEIARMQDVRIDSLCLRFGYPWVYQHQGNCEHLIVFSDARLMSVDDELAVSAYPKIQRIKQRRSRLCMMCSLFGVHWVITDSDRIPHNPCYLCRVCFKSYNYIDGKKIGNFRAYRYPQHPELIPHQKEPPPTDET